jgi:hypothetical protein
MQMTTKKRPARPKGPNLKRGGFTDARWRLDEYAKARAKALSADTPPKRPDLTEADQLADQYMISRRFGELTRMLEHNGEFLKRIAKALEALAKPQQTAEVPVQQYMSGQWHRRDGDIYDRVAEPGTPNAGTTMADEMFGTAHDAPEKGHD